MDVAENISTGRRGLIVGVRWPLIALLFLGCNFLLPGSSTEPNDERSPTSEISAPTPTNTPTPLPAISAPPQPSSGSTNIYGRVIWQGEPYVGLEIKLSGLSSIAERWYVNEKVTSDEDGIFLFADIPPGNDYVLSVEIENSDFQTGEVGAAVLNISVSPDKNYSIGEYYLLPTDIIMLSPARNSEISDSTLSLSWEPYPGAAYYQFELVQIYGTLSNVVLDTEDTQVNITQPLMDCTYGWDITAFSETGIPLAKTDAEFVNDIQSFSEKFDGLFRIVNDDLPSCYLQLKFPAELANLSLEEGNSGFLWETHPLANRYYIQVDRVYDASGNIAIELGIISEFIEVLEDGSIPTADFLWLDRGQYRWRVVAYLDGVSIAASSGASNLSVFVIE